MFTWSQVPNFVYLSPLDCVNTMHQVHGAGSVFITSAVTRQKLRVMFKAAIELHEGLVV